MDFAGGRAQHRGRRRHPRGLPTGRGDQLGRPGAAGRAEVRRHRQTAAAQRQQFGFNNDFAALLPIEGQANRFLLVTNHEYVTPQFMFPGADVDAPTREQFDIEIAALGMSVVEVERTPEGGLRPVTGRYNRRITADTPFTLTGPAAGTDFVKTPADPTGRTIAGTFANCAGGVTPWGTVLSGEEELQPVLRRRQEFFRAGAVMREHGRGKRWLLLRRWKTVRGSKRVELQTLFAVNRRCSKRMCCASNSIGCGRTARPGVLNFVLEWIRALRWQRLPEMERLGAFLFRHIEGIAAYCDHPVRFGVVESINTTIKAVLRRAKGMRDDQMLLPEVEVATTSPHRCRRDLAPLLSPQGLTQIGEEPENRKSLATIACA